MQEEQAEHHIVSPKVYVIIFGTLLLFTAITVMAAYVEMGPFNPIVALAIACIKAVLVVLYFMHIRYSSKLMKLTIASGIFMFVVLMSMTLSDYMSRAWGQW